MVNITIWQQDGDGSEIQVLCLWLAYSKNVANHEEKCNFVRSLCGLYP